MCAYHKQRASREYVYKRKRRKVAPRCTATTNKCGKHIPTPGVQRLCQCSVALLAHKVDYFCHRFVSCQAAVVQ